jgi:hypothetical protein
MHFSLSKHRPTAPTFRRHLPVVVTVLTVACASPAWAQKVTTVEELTLRQTINTLTDGLAVRPVGESIGLVTAAEIATAPLSTSSGGFVFKLDPSTGLLARTATTFGPSLTDRALTAGEGQISMGATFSASTYDKLSDFALGRLPLGSITAASPTVARTGTGDFQISSKTLTLGGSLGVTENFDIGVVVPLISVKFSGITSLVNGSGTVVRFAEGGATFSGLGDIAAIAKYRFVKFKGGPLPDPGGIALLVNMRLPTGDRDNLRGLGVTRTLASVVVSAGKGKLKPHGNIGFEVWSKSVDVLTSPPTGPNQFVSLRHQLQAAAGIEIEAAPKVTLLLDYLHQHIRGGGEIQSITDTPATNVLGITALQSLVAVDEGIKKGLLVPGLKVNLKGKMLLSLNAIITLRNNGLHAKITPVAGINLTM